MVMIFHREINRKVLYSAVSNFKHSISGRFPTNLVSSVSLIRPLLAPKIGEKPLFYYFEFCIFLS